MTKKTTLFLLFFTIFAFPVTVYGEKEEEVEKEEKRERYLTPEDKRDASLGREIADGVTVSWLLETESQRLKEDYGDRRITLDTETAYTVQLAAEIEFADWIVLELVGEADKERVWRSQLEEGIFALEWKNWSADVGRLYVPFGEYYSQFISDIALEAGETRGLGMSLDYNIGESIETSIYFVHHDDDRVNIDKKDWGAGIVYQAANIDAQMALAYLSAFVDDDEDIVEIYGSEEKLHNAWTANALLSLDDWLFTVESVRAERRGINIPHQFQHFGATNVEVGYYGIDSLRFSLRYQDNRGVLSSPIKQFGWGFNWTTNFNFSFTVEHMWNTYQRHDELDVLKDRESNFGMVIEF